MLKVAYIGNFSELWHEEGNARSLEKLGHIVLRVDERAFSPVAFNDLIRTEKPDFVIWAKLKININHKHDVQQIVKENNVKRICWIPDLYFGLSREYRIKTKDDLFDADFVFSPDGGHQEEFKEAGINHHVLRQGIYDEFCFLDKPTKLYEAAQIIFVGTENPEYPYRSKLLRFLERKYGHKFKLFGKGDLEIRGPALNSLYASTKVVVGDSVYSPYYWSNRIYETIGRGGFLIHPRVPGIEQEFEAFKHFIPYDHNDFEALCEAIDYFVSHETARRAIAEAGFEHCKKNHTLLHRSQELIKVITT